MARRMDLCTKQVHVGITYRRRFSSGAEERLVVTAYLDATPDTLFRT
jgi:hypothetical protein